MKYLITILLFVSCTKGINQPADSTSPKPGSIREIYSYSQMLSFLDSNVTRKVIANAGTYVEVFKWQFESITYDNPKKIIDSCIFWYSVPPAPYVVPNFRENDKPGRKTRTIEFQQLHWCASDTTIFFRADVYVHGKTSIVYRNAPLQFTQNLQAYPVYNWPADPKSIHITLKRTQ